MPPTPARLDDLIAALVVFTRQILSRFEEPSPSIRNTIIRNFIARSITTVTSIHALAGLQHSGDCWTLFRSLSDRLFHLHWLGVHGEFEVFEEWSFIRQFDAQQRALSDPGVKQHRGSVARPTPEQKKRYRELKQKAIIWHRPKAEDAARSLQMPFLFKYGYDFASTHVHPMANDGEDEFLLLSGAAPTDLMEVVENAVLIHTMILQEGLNHSSWRWAGVVYEFLEAARHGIVEDAPYREILLKLHSAGPEFQWSDASPAA